MGLQLEQLLCPVLVGRDDELVVLRGALDRALHGGVRGVFIAGEAGVGKSRLTRALLKETRAHGLNPISGLCAPHDTGVPYGPIVDALRRAFARIPADTPAIQRALAPATRTVAPLLPELGGIAGEMAAEPPAALRQRLFRALTHTLRTMAACRPDATLAPAPLVLLVEDVHWADESTLDLLQFLLRSAWDIEEDEPGAGQGVLVICTLRNEMLAALPALTRTITALLATRLAIQIELHPLTFEQFEEFLAATLDRPIAAAMAATLYERSEGNPFVAEELLNALAAGGYLDGATGAEPVAAHLPLSLRGAVLDRLNLLPQSARTLLSAAAVVGRVFDVDVLARATGLERTALHDGLRLALQSGLIEENPAGGGSATGTTGDRYRFRHALTRDVIYGELLAPERRALHAVVGRVLEEGLADDGADSGDVIEAVAYHYRLAGDRARAPHFALRAAQRARTLLSFAEARRHYAEALPFMPEDDPARLPILESLGLLSLALLDLRGAVPYLDAATNLLRTLGLTRKAAVVLGETHHLLWFVDLARFRGMVDDLDRVAEEARGEADGGGPEDADALKTYAAAALAHASYANYARARVWAERTLELAARLDVAEPGGSPAATASAVYKALLARGHALIHGEGGGDAPHDGWAEAGLNDFNQALELGLRYALPEAVQMAYNFLPRALLDLGRDAEATALIARADDYARRSGVAAIADTRGYSLLYAGRWDEGIAVLREASAASRAFGAASKLAMELTALGHLLVAQGDGRAAAEALEEALAILEPSGQFVGLGPCLRGLASARALLGDHAAAALHFARAMALWRTTQDAVAVVPLLLDGCLYHAERGDARRAAEWADDLARVARRRPLLVALAATAHAQGVVGARAGNGSEAAGLLRTAVGRWEALSRPYETARARTALGVALLGGARGDQAQRAEADAILVAAVEGFERLGARHDAATAEDVRRRAGLLAQARRRQSLAEGRAPYGGLTPREREVLRLMVEGRTNREIARAVFITEGTAELHVSHILGKLGSATRAQAVAYALANRLIEPP